jgi:hypothetical protein
VCRAPALGRRVSSRHDRTQICPCVFSLTIANGTIAYCGDTSFIGFSYSFRSYMSWAPRCGMNERARRAYRMRTLAYLLPNTRS